MNNHPIKLSGDLETRNQEAPITTIVKSGATATKPKTQGMDTQMPYQFVKIEKN